MKSRVSPVADIQQTIIGALTKHKKLRLGQLISKATHLCPSIVQGALDIYDVSDSELLGAMKMYIERLEGRAKRPKSHP